MSIRDNGLEGTNSIRTQVSNTGFLVLRFRQFLISKSTKYLAYYFEEAQKKIMFIIYYNWESL